ncbi:beta-lactamase family protein [Lysobacter antibioticus]|nr:beta-lactamase family protein [Lysobacter antibioticus]
MSSRLRGNQTKALPVAHALSQYRPMRTLTLTLGLSALIAGCAGAPVSSTTDPASADPATAERVDALMRDYAGTGPGASLLVVRGGQAVLRRGYGLAEVESGAAATPQTNYRLASISKQFTAAAVLLLVEDGKLGLDDPIKRWLPSLPKAADAITLRQILSHTSGLIDYEDVMPPEFDDRDRQMHDRDVLRVLEGQDRTYFVPGRDYRYSNSGYALLALTVEQASGKRYADFLRERIFLPLGMRDTVAYERGVSEVAHRAYGYSFEGRWTRTDQSPTSAVLGDGGIYSSIDDLTRWDAALYDDRLLSDASRRLAFSPHTSTDLADVAYGYGWRITGETLWHSGESIGFRNVIVRYPQRRLTVVLLSNRNDPEPYRLALRIAELYLPAAAEAGR